MSNHNTKKKVLAVSSSGGHWIQLMRLRKSWDGCDVAYLTTEDLYRESVLSDAIKRNLNPPEFYSTVPASAWNKFNLVRQLFKVILVLIYVRPDVIISTGASIGYFAFKAGKLIGIKTIWIDSIANAEQLSLSGEKVKSCADIWLTQWPHLADQSSENIRKTKSPDHWGAVL